jgi:hypothetical protein
MIRTLLRIPWLAILPALLHAQGGPPLVTDDPGTVEPGHWEVNVAWTREHRPEATADELPLLDISYGWSAHLQLKIEGSWLQLSGDDHGRRAGVSGALAGVKWRFADEETCGVAVSTFPQVGFPLGQSAQRRGIVSGSTVFILPVELQKNFGALAANVDVGYMTDNRDAERWFAGLAVGHEFASHWELLAELHGETAVGVRGSSLLANLGTRIPLREHVTLLFSVGRELYNATETRATVSYLGLQLTR